MEKLIKKNLYKKNLWLETWHDYITNIKKL